MGMGMGLRGEDLTGAIPSNHPSRRVLAAFTPRDDYFIPSVTEEIGNKTRQLSNEAEMELKKVKAGALGPIELFSPKYFAACIFGGVIACAPTHAGVTPLDLVKCRRQVNSSLYKSNIQGWSQIIKAEGAGGLFTGFGATFIGYGFQGAGKYGGYEFFKYQYGKMVGQEVATKYKTPLYLAASASAEFIADIFLCPWESIKVRLQTTIPPYASGTMDGWRKVTATEGIAGLYKGLYPLWARQIPYTMTKFASFENIVQAIYGYLPKKREEYSGVQQTGISFVGGYMAGILCAIVSHPADVMVSKLNANRMAGEGAGTALGRIYKDIGFSGLWNGLGVRIVMIGTLTGFQWYIYDGFKVWLGLPAT